MLGSEFYLDINFKKEIMKKVTFTLLLSLCLAFTISSCSKDDDNSLLVGKWLLTKLTMYGESQDLTEVLLYYTFTNSRYIPSGTDIWGNSDSEATTGPYTYKNDVITLHNEYELIELDVISLTDRLLVVVFREYMEMEFTRQ